MVVRIRFRLSPVSPLELGARRELVLLLSALLTPAAVVALALALWRIGSDLNFTEHFVISQGFFSHWQSWLLVAAVLQATSVLLNRLARRDRNAAAAAPYRRHHQAMP